MNTAILQNWIENKIAVADKDDVAWWWSNKGMNEISGINRLYLSNALYGDKIPSYMEHSLKDQGFSIDGFINKESS